MALVLAMSTWPLNFFVEGKFDMSLFAFAFPLDVLAAASITVHNYTQTDTMKARIGTYLRRESGCAVIHQLSTNCRTQLPL